MNARGIEACSFSRSDRLARVALRRPSIRSSFFFVFLRGFVTSMKRLPVVNRIFRSFIASQPPHRDDSVAFGELRHPSIRVSVGDRHRRA
jgi:hypothetical protein